MFHPPSLQTVFSERGSARWRSIPKDLFTHPHHSSLRQPRQELERRRPGWCKSNTARVHTVLQADDAGWTIHNLVTDIFTCQFLQHDLDWPRPPPLFSSLGPHDLEAAAAGDSRGGGRLSLTLRLWYIFPPDGAPERQRWLFLIYSWGVECSAFQHKALTVSTADLRDEENHFAWLTQPQLKTVETFSCTRPRSPIFHLTYWR